MPSLCICASAGAYSSPSSSAVRIWFVVLFTTPRNPSILTAGIVSRTRLNTGTPSITVPSNRNDVPLRAAIAESSSYANATGPLFAVTTWQPAASASRT